MNQPAASLPAPINGHEIRVPLTMAFGVIGMGFIGLFFGGTIALAQLSGFSFGGPAGRYEFTSGAGLLALVLGSGGLLLIAAGIVLLLNRGGLVMGHDRLQYVVNRKKVITQIPYHNISRMEIAESDTGRFIGIDLANLADPNTFHPDAEGCKKYSNWHYKIELATPQMPLEHIYQYIVNQRNARRG
ncbi:hypothetical protein ETAA8_34930 [Anatilimnocola aggregata]|uniref:Photosystem I assembly protein Ycf4 n=1 Tax=Anatilimnocola aggregata TaxID=2528021 RepID=A0A517YDS2_9BACT|nr:hypothetical protein [Anatilimnocola aggregata]QDU28393.1 hypothetical protein ETAA8_34930 [Anatilimnocola aggregata]